MPLYVCLIISSVSFIYFFDVHVKLNTHSVHYFFTWHYLTTYITSTHDMSVLHMICIDILTIIIYSRKMECNLPLQCSILSVWYVSPHTQCDFFVLTDKFIIYLKFHCRCYNNIIITLQFGKVRRALCCWYL